MYKLHKHSLPGFTKSFDTLHLLTEEVSKQTCGHCLDSYGTDLLSMLASYCGFKFRVEGLTLDQSTTISEQREEHYWNTYVK